MANEITVKVKGIPEALAHLKKYQVKKKDEIKKELRIGALKIEGLAKEIAPFDSGRLSGSITTDTSEIDSLVVKVGTDVKYAPYVEFGHKQTPGRFVPAIGKRLVAKFVHGKPFLFPAFFSHENGIIKAIGKILKKDISIT